VAQRVERGQVNRTPRSDWADYRDIVFRNVLTLFNAMVVPAAVVLFQLGEYKGAWAVSAFAFLNTLLGLVQEVRAKWHLDRLAILAETRARVLRDGAAQTVPAGQVVLDDVVLLHSGEPVVADGKLLAAQFLEIDEALLTGESDPVPRRPGERVLSGSYCVAGEGAYKAEKVGTEAFAQDMSSQARRYRYAASPLQRSIDSLIKILTVTAVVLCLLYILLAAIRGFTTAEVVKMVAATITSMVPQGLILMTTLAFTLGAVRMASRGAVVQRLSAVESMAEVDVLCMDKTGTLTTSRLELDQVRSLADGLSEDQVRDRLHQFAWASGDVQNKSIQALRAGLDGRSHPPAEVIDRLPFKSQNRYSAVRVRTPKGKERVLVLGAFEALRPLLAQGAAGRAEEVWQDLLDTGLRLLLFAEGEGAGPAKKFEGALQGVTLKPLAVVALADELRPDAGEVLGALAGQNIRFKILSGDNPETVKATVAHLDLPLAREPVVSGDELAKAPEAERLRLLNERSVFGRVTPQQKLDIVGRLQAQGSRVAMLGDGINDILSIKRAELGIAMGEGASATKTVAGLVLENNRFDLLPAALDEGRTILRNLRRAGKLFLTKNVYTLFLVVVATGLLRLPFPYEPQQVTLLNMLTIGIPAFLITLGRARAPASQEGYLKEVGWFAVTTGLILGIAGLVVWLVAVSTPGTDEQTQLTLLFTTLVVMGLASLLRALTDREKGVMAEDWPLWVWVAAAVPLYLAVMYSAALQSFLGLPGWTAEVANFFELTPLDWGQWGLVLAAAAPAFLACKLVDWLGPLLRKPLAA
jgi:cation-transporting ATPase E